MKRGILLFSVLWALYNCTQEKSPTLIKGTPEQEKIEQWIAMVNDSSHIAAQKRGQFLEKALQQINKLGNDSLELEYLSSVSLAYKQLGDSTSFRSTNLNARKKAERLKDYNILGESHWDMASFLLSYNITDSAYYHYQKAYKSFNSLPVDSTSLSLNGRMLYSMGRIQQYFNDFLGAEKNVVEALRIFNDLSDTKRIYLCNNLLGLISSGMNNSEASLSYYDKAGKTIQDLKPTDQSYYQWQNKNNIAYEHLSRENYLKAEEVYSELLLNKESNPDKPSLYAKALTSLGYATFKGRGNFIKAEDLIKKSIHINDSIGYAEDQARTKYYYAELLAAMGDTITALENAQESKALASEANNYDDQLNILRVLTRIDGQNAVAYSDEYYKISEKLKEEERAKRDKFARIRLETDEVIERNELLARQKQIWIGVVLGLILLGIAFGIIVFQLISNNRLKFQQKQQESNQEIYNLMLSQKGKLEEGKKLEKKRVSEELHDGILGQMLGIRLILTGLNEQTDPSSVQQRSELIEKLRELEEEIRMISHELNDASYEKFYNFIVSMEDLIHTTSKSSGIICSFRFTNDVHWDNLEGDLKINIYRIVQESLQNCVKHAECSKVDIDFDLEGKSLVLTIMDDGAGFKTSRGKRGIGLRNINSRAEKLEGECIIDSKKGEGTTVLVKLPCSYITLDSAQPQKEDRTAVNA